MTILFFSCLKSDIVKESKIVIEKEVTDKYVIGFSNGFSMNSWRAEMLASLRLEAQKYPDLELIVLDEPGDLNKQIADIESFIARRVDAIILIPNSSQAVTPVLKKAIKLGIKIVNFNLPLMDPEAYHVYVGPDEYKRGEQWARWLAEKLDNKGKIVMFGGIPGNPGTEMAVEGALSVFQKTAIQILAYRDTYWQEDRARKIMHELLIKYPEIDGIWSDGGQASAGAIRALIDSDFKLVPVTGDDYNGLFSLYLEYHKTNPDFDLASISTPTWQGKVALQNAIKLVDGEEVSKWIKIESEIITGIDAESYIRRDCSDSIFIETDLPLSVLREIH